MKQHQGDCGIFFPGETATLFGGVGMLNASDLRKPETSPRDLNFGEYDYSVLLILNSAAVLEQSENLDMSSILQRVPILVQTDLNIKVSWFIYEPCSRMGAWGSPSVRVPSCAHTECAEAQRESCFPGVNTHSSTHTHTHTPPFVLKGGKEASEFPTLQGHGVCPVQTDESQ